MLDITISCLGRPPCTSVAANGRHGCFSNTTSRVAAPAMAEMLLPPRTTTTRSSLCDFIGGCNGCVSPSSLADAKARSYSKAVPPRDRCCVCTRQQDLALMATMSTMGMQAVIGGGCVVAPSPQDWPGGDGSPKMPAVLVIRWPRKYTYKL